MQWFRKIKREEPLLLLGFYLLDPPPEPLQGCSGSFWAKCQELSVAVASGPFGEPLQRFGLSAAVHPPPRPLAARAESPSCLPAVVTPLDKSAGAAMLGGRPSLLDAPPRSACPGRGAPAGGWSGSGVYLLQLLYLRGSHAVHPGGEHPAGWGLGRSFLREPLPGLHGQGQRCHITLPAHRSRHRLRGRWHRYPGNGPGRRWPVVR